MSSYPKPAESSPHSYTLLLNTPFNNNPLLKPFSKGRLRTHMLMLTRSHLITRSLNMTFDLLQVSILLAAGVTWSM